VNKDVKIPFHLSPGGFINMDLQKRETLQRISGNALALSQKVKNPFWISAYKALAESADRIDALIARSIES